MWRTLILNLAATNLTWKVGHFCGFCLLQKSDLRLLVVWVMSSSLCFIEQLQYTVFSNLSYFLVEQHNTTRKWKNNNNWTCGKKVRGLLPSCLANTNNIQQKAPRHRDLENINISWFQTNRAFFKVNCTTCSAHTWCQFGSQHPARNLVYKETEVIRFCRRN